LALIKDVAEHLTLLLAPFTPHMCEELWQGVLAQVGSVHRADWPLFDASAAVADEVELAVQVNGKVRGKVTVPTELGQERIIEIALSEVASHIEGKEIRKVVLVPGKLVSVVVSG
jgi:leucyl-tRNA synthetase